MRILAKTLVGIVALAALAGPALAQGKTRIGVVVKIGGIPWFNQMEEGIKRAGAELGVDAWMIGPTAADAALQVRALEDLIAQKVDVIGIVATDPAVVAPVLARAKAAGIHVVSAETPDQTNKDWDVEVALGTNIGERHMDALAAANGGKGKYAVYVGGLTVPLHNAWADAAIAYQKEKYPDMQLVAERFPVAESVDDSYRTTLDLMRANPDLTGVISFGSQGPIGAGRAVEEREAADRVAVVGLFSPSQGASLVKSGAIKEGFIWSPALGGEMVVRVGKMLVDGQTPKDGMEMPNVGPVKVDAAAGTIIGSKLLTIDKDTIDQLVSEGL